MRERYLKMKENKIQYIDEDKLKELNTRYEKLKEQRTDILKEQMRKRGLRDLIFLSEEILGAWNVGEIHHKWADILDRFWKSKEAELLLLLAPRGSLKSSIVTCNWVIQRILNNPNIRALITNEKEDNAKKFLGIIREHFENNQMLRYVYGDFTSKEKKWTEYEFTVGNRTKGGIREPTVMIGSIDKSPVSLHQDLIIEDDLQSRLNIQTKDQIDKVWQYHKDLLSLLEPGGKRIVIGTRWDFGDIYSRIIDKLSPNDTINDILATEETRKQYV